MSIRKLTKHTPIPIFYYKKILEHTKQFLKSVLWDSLKRSFGFCFFLIKNSEFYLVQISRGSLKTTWKSGLINLFLNIYLLVCFIWQWQKTLYTQDTIVKVLVDVLILAWGRGSHYLSPSINSDLLIPSQSLRINEDTAQGSILKRSLPTTPTLSHTIYFCSPCTSHNVLCLVPPWWTKSVLSNRKIMQATDTSYICNFFFFLSQAQSPQMFPGQRPRPNPCNNTDPSLSSGNAKSLTTVYVGNSYIWNIFKDF